MDPSPNRSIFNLFQNDTHYNLSSTAKLQDAEDKVHQISAKIDLAKKRSNITRLTSNATDWTVSYKNFDKLEDIEELERQKLLAEKNKESIKEYHSNLLGHSHEHSEEKKIFDLTNAEKLKLCDKYAILGLSKHKELSFDKAAELYNISISYSEYVFPDNDTESSKLAAIRYLCYMNMSTVSFVRRDYTKALEYAKLSLKETIDPKLLAKSNCLTGNVFEALHEYSLANDHYSKAMSLYPTLEGIAQRIQALKEQVQLTLSNEKLLAMSMLGQRATTTNPVPLQPDAGDLIFNYAMPIEPMSTQHTTSDPSM